MSYRLQGGDVEEIVRAMNGPTSHYSDH